YDVKFLDRGQELTRKTAALTVIPIILPPTDSGPSPLPRTGLVFLHAIGRFVGLGRGDAAMVRPGAKFDLLSTGMKGTDTDMPIGEVIEARPMEPGTQAVQTGPGHQL